MRRPGARDLGRLAVLAVRAAGAVAGEVGGAVRGAVDRAVGGAATPPAGDDLRAAGDPRGLVRGPAVRLHLDGRPIPAFEGETVGAALLAAGVRTLRETRFEGRPRGLLCGIGSCHDCLVTVDGSGPVRACLTPVADGMRVATHRPGGPAFDPAAVDLRGVDGGA
jgi:hypothetical protein